MSYILAASFLGTPGKLGERFLLANRVTNQSKKGEIHSLCALRNNLNKDAILRSNKISNILTILLASDFKRKHIVLRTDPHIEVKSVKSVFNYKRQ